MRKPVGRGRGPFAVFVWALFCAAPLYALEPANVRLGPLYLTPTLDLEQIYIDNLLRSENNEIDSWGTIINPYVQLWAQNNLDTYSLSYELEDGRYVDSSDDDYTDHRFRSEIHKVLAGIHSIDLFAKYLNNSQPRGTGLTEGSLSTLIDEPLKYDLTGYGAQYTMGTRETRGRLELELRTEEIKYKNFRDLSRGYDRDDDTWRGTVYYKVGGRTDILAEFRLVDTDYRLGLADSGALPDLLDSDEQIYLLGASWEATANTTGSIKVGAFDRDLEADNRSNDNGVHWEAEVQWEPRTFTTVELATRRISTETNGVGDFTDSREYDLDWHYEWSSRLATRMNLFYADDSYPGSGRDDERYEVETRVDYRFRLWFDLGAGYRFERRSSNAESLDYTRNEVFVDVKLSL